MVEAEETLESIKELVKETVRERPLSFVAVAVAVVAVLVFWETILRVFFGLFLAALFLLAVFGGILLWAKLKYSQPGYKALVSEKKTILRAIKIAETRYMKRKLSKKDFNKIFKEKQSALIKVEAKLNELSAKANEKEIDEELLAVQTKKRHVLKGLLDKKRRLVKEMNIAEKLYLKRKIDSKTYQALVQKNQKSLIDLEAKIKQLHSEANIVRVMENLKQGLSDIESGNLRKKRKKQREKREKEIRIAKEIAKQVKEE
jgi:hypothetical protein